MEYKWIIRPKQTTASDLCYRNQHKNRKRNNIVRKLINFTCGTLANDEDTIKMYNYSFISIPHFPLKTVKLWLHVRFE